MESQMKRLKEEADIKTVVDALGIPVERKGMNYFLCCPSPEHDDTNPSAYFKDGWNRRVLLGSGQAGRQHAACHMAI